MLESKIYTLTSYLLQMRTFISHRHRISRFYLFYVYGHRLVRKHHLTNNPQTAITVKVVVSISETGSNEIMPYQFA